MGYVYSCGIFNVFVVLKTVLRTELDIWNASGTLTMWLRFCSKLIDKCVNSVCHINSMHTSIAIIFFLVARAVDEFRGL